MDKKNKKILTMNIIKFVLGTLLLLAAFGYLQSHPAEKRSRNTGIQIIFDKIGTFFEKSTGTYDEANDYKKNMINSYEELLFISETTKCITGSMKEDLYETYNTLQSEDIEHFKQYKDNYYLVRSEYRQHIENNCEANK